MAKELGGNAEESLKEALQDEESLALFLEQMRVFVQRFCEGMMKGGDFTIRFEAHGNNRELLHAKVYTDDIVRPRGKRKR